LHHAFLVGDKVYLRRFEETDLHGDYFDWLNDYEVTRYLDSGTFPNSEQSVEQFVAGVNPKAVMFAIMVRGTETYIGNTKIDNISPDREVSDESN